MKRKSSEFYGICRQSFITLNKVMSCCCHMLHIKHNVNWVGVFYRCLVTWMQQIEHETMAYGSHDMNWGCVNSMVSLPSISSVLTKIFGEFMWFASSLFLTIQMTCISVVHDQTKLASKMKFGLVCVYSCILPTGFKIITYVMHNK